MTPEPLKSATFTISISTSPRRRRWPGWRRTVGGAKWGCLDCKRVLADNMVAALKPIRERAFQLREEPGRVDEILADGASAARRMATDTMREVRDRMGLLPAGRKPAVEAR